MFHFGIISDYSENKNFTIFPCSYKRRITLEIYIRKCIFFICNFAKLNEAIILLMFKNDVFPSLRKYANLFCIDIIYTKYIRR